MEKDEKKAAQASDAILDEEQLEQVAGGGNGVELDEEPKQKLSTVQTDGQNNCASFLFPDYWS